MGVFCSRLESERNTHKQLITMLCQHNSVHSAVKQLQLYITSKCVTAMNISYLVSVSILRAFAIRQRFGLRS